MLLAAVISGAAVLPVCTSADEDKTYVPTVYFKANEPENAELLKSGAVYIDRSAADAGDISISAELYIKDTQKRTGAFTIMWSTDSSELLLSDLTDPITLTGKAPYKAITSPSSMNLTYSEEKNRMIANFNTFSISSLELTSENSDDIPLAGFTVKAGSDLAYGCHQVQFLQEERTYLCSLSMRYDDGDFSEKILTGENALPLRVNVSDRMLGDINDSKWIDAVDASAALATYALISTNKPTGLTPAQEAAADVDGDGDIDAVDASAILAYYAYTSTEHEDDLTFVEFIRKEG